MIDEYFKLNKEIVKYSYDPNVIYTKSENQKRISKIDQLLEEMNKIEYKLREPGVVYYFINSPIHGTTKVIDKSERCWIDNPKFDYEGPNFYHFITKSPKDKFYKYFTYPTSKIPTGYQPPEFKKLVHFEDASSLGLTVISHFNKIEQKERKK